MNGPPDSIWINGCLIASDTVRIDPRDRGFTLGDGLYETIRVQGGRPLRLDRHFTRLGEGLKLLEFSRSLDETSIGEGIRATLSASGLTEAAVRITISRGVAARGLLPDPEADPTIAISVNAYAPPTPARVMIATVTRRNAQSPLSRIKTINCLDSILARIEAGRAGMDDAVLLNGSGHVAEASAANIFAVWRDIVATPPIKDGALPGIMRGAIMAQLPVEERSISPDDLADADEIFITSSLGIRPVIAFGERALEIGAVTTEVITAIESNEYTFNSW